MRYHDLFMQGKQRTIYTDPTARPRRAGTRVVKLPEKTPPVPVEEDAVPQAESMPRKPSTDRKEETKLDRLVTTSQVVLFKCKTIWPFDFFPDEFSIEPAQVNLKRKIFFYTHEVSSIPIKNISDVIVYDTLFFAGMTVIDQFFHQNSLQISFMWKKDAHEARKIIQGLVVANREEVDTAKIAPKKLLKQVQKIGKMQAID